MNELKNKIIDKINLIEDEAVIKSIDNLLENLISPDIQKLSEGEKELIRMGIKDFEEGNFIDDDELRKQEDQWLKN